MSPFDVDLTNCRVRNFPYDAGPEFAHLASMPSQHKTFWTNTHKVKRFGLEYGQILLHYHQHMKTAGHKYMNAHWLDHSVDQEYVWFLFSMVNEPVLLDLVIDNPTVQQFVDAALLMIEQLEDNMTVAYGDQVLCAHDYKMFNVTFGNDSVTCFDYDRFSVVDVADSLYDEFLEKLEQDDLTTTEINFSQDEQNEILDLCRRKINEYRSKKNT